MLHRATPPIRLIMFIAPIVFIAHIMFIAHNQAAKWPTDGVGGAVRYNRLD
jgi:hypothetical protein